MDFANDPLTTIIAALLTGAAGGGGVSRVAGARKARDVQEENARCETHRARLEATMEYLSKRLDSEAHRVEQLETARTQQASDTATIKAQVEGLRDRVDHGFAEVLRRLDARHGIREGDA